MSKSHPQETTSHFRIPSWLPYLVFAVATLFFFRAHIFGNAFFWDDFTEYVYPVRAFAAKHISQGEIPFWNPYTFSGMPFMADVQTALFYPPNLILDLISGATTYPIKNLQLLIILHFFIAQCSMFLLCRRLKISPMGGLIAAVSYGFSSPLVLHAFHPMQVEHLAWFPLIASFFYAAITTRSVLNAVVAGLLLGMTMLSGSPQMTLYIALFLGLLLIWYLIADLVTKRSSLLQAASMFVIGCLTVSIAFGVFCVQYLPVREIASLSERKEISFDNAAVGSLQKRQLITAAVPKAFGSTSADQQNKAQFFINGSDYYLYWDTAFYFGVVTFFLGIFGAISTLRKRETQFLIAIALFGFLYALGSHGFLFQLFFNLPFFNVLRIPARMMFYCAFAGCLLAGFGFDAIIASVKTKTTTYKLIGAAAVPLVFAIGVTLGLFAEVPNEVMEKVLQSYATTAIVFIVLACAIAFLLYRRVLNAWSAGFTFMVLCFIDLIVVNGDFNSAKPNPVKEYQRLFSEQMKQQLLPAPPKSVFRVSMRAPGVIALKRNQGMTDGIMLYEGYNQLLLARRHPQVGDLKKMFDLLSIRYEIVIDSVRGGASFVERKDYFPNAWMNYQVVFATEENIKDVMKTVTDYHDVTVLETSPVQQFSQKRSAEVNHSVQCMEYTDNHTKYSVQTDEAGVVCFSEIWYPAWQVYVDDKPARMLRANYCLRAVEVPAGSHTVEWRYESASFRSGIFITLATLAFSVAIMVVQQIRGMKTKVIRNDV